MTFLNFGALVLVLIMPKSRHARLRGKDYAFYYEAWQRQAVSWLNGLIKKIDAPETPTALFNKRYSAEFFDLAHRQETTAGYWQGKAAAMAGHTSVATPGEIFGNLHDQTKGNLEPLFKQASDALDKAGL